MIRSCEDVKTVSDFNEFYDARYNAYIIGLKETADIICWDENNLISPELIISFQTMD